MVREFSAGGLVLRKMRGRWFLAVIEPHMERSKEVPAKPSHSKKGVAQIIALPKGAIDKGEKAEQTALREVEEETGLRAEILGKLADIKYVYVRTWGDKARVFKIVSFYLLLYRGGKLDKIAPEMRIEVQRAFWIALDEAPTMLSYKGEREVAAKALEYVAAHPEIGEEVRETAR